MLHEFSGDILLSSAAVIAHGVAPNDPFHSGLALQLRERFPAMYKDFRHYCQTAHPKPGEIWAWAGAGPDGPVRIVALMTQEGGYEHGAKPKPASVSHVGHALKAFRKWIDDEKPASVAIPKLATGVGGLEWEQVHPLIKQHLAGSVPVYLYSTYHKGVKSAEPGPRVVREVTPHH
jgi:O-acetyl-ADP-ribose deacetylase (regulator of RNase III)